MCDSFWHVTACWYIYCYSWLWEEWIIFGFQPWCCGCVSTDPWYFPLNRRRQSQRKVLSVKDCERPWTPIFSCHRKRHWTAMIVTQQTSDIRVSLHRLIFIYLTFTRLVLGVVDLPDNTIQSGISHSSLIISLNNLHNPLLSEWKLYSILMRLRHKTYLWHSLHLFKNPLSFWILQDTPGFCI